MTGGLTAPERRRYAEDGFVFPIPVLSPREVRRYRRACDRLERQLGGRPRTVEVRQMHLHFRWAYELATHPRLLDAAQDVLGPDLLIWATELFAKHPRDEAVSIGWHRDRPYMGFDARLSTTAWVALGPSTPANGCMRAVPDPRRHTARGGVPDRGRSAEDVPGAVDVVLRPGTMSLHDPDVLHGAGPNRSRIKRVGFVIRFVTPAARPPGGKLVVLRARGRGGEDHFELAPPPARAGRSALAGMRASAGRHFEAVLENLRRGATQERR